MKKIRFFRNPHNKGYFFIIPYFALFLLFGLYPILYTLRLSFHSWDGIRDPVFVGIANYRRLLSDSVFLLAIRNTIWISIVAIVFQMIFGVGLAFLLSQRKIRFGKGFKTIFYFPNLVTPITLAAIFSLLFARQGGFNQLLLSWGLLDAPVDWALNATFAQMIISFILWFQFFGFYVIIFTAGISAIPNDILEAAEIDGASRMKILWMIVLPLIKPIITYASIIAIVGGMQIFDLNFVIGGPMGNPNYRTMSVVLHMYTTTFRNHNLGYGATISYGIFVLIIVFSVIYLRMTVKRREG